MISSFFRKSKLLAYISFKVRELFYMLGCYSSRIIGFISCFCFILLPLFLLVLYLSSGTSFQFYPSLSHTPSPIQPSPQSSVESQPLSMPTILSKVPKGSSFFNQIIAKSNDISQSQPVVDLTPSASQVEALINEQNQQPQDTEQHQPHGDKVAVPLTRFPLPSTPPPFDYPIGPTDLSISYCLIVMSATREENEDYTTNLFDQLDYHTINWPNVHLVLYNSDLDPTTRPHLQTYAPTIVIPNPDDPTREHLKKLDPKNKYGDDMERLHWRSKLNLDYVVAMKYCESTPTNFTIILEEDVLLTTNFMHKIEKIAKEKPLPWIGWTLYNTNEWEAYRPTHGARFAYGCCTQGMMWYNKILPDVSAWIQKNYLIEPIDWNMRDFIKVHKWPFYVVVPNLVQHLGIVSTLRGRKPKIGHASSNFVDPRNLTSAEREWSQLARSIRQPARLVVRSNVLPDDS